MTGEMLFVFALLLTTILLFVQDRIRMDVIALMVVVALAVSGIISPVQAVSGFGESIVIMIAGLFIVGEGLFRTGVAAAAGNWLLRMGGSSETRLLLFLLPTVALLSAFMSSTGAVALLIPVVLSMARRSGMQPSRLLMPLAFASLIGGMLTLIGTPPNIIVSGQMRAAGFEPFSFFDFTPIGAVILFVGTIYLVFIARHLLPASDVRDPEHSHPGLKEFAERYGLSHHLYKLKIKADSELAGKTLSEAALRTEYEVTVIAMQHLNRLISPLKPVMINTRMQVQDTLLVYGDRESIDRLCNEMELSILGFPEQEIEQLYKQFGLAEVMLPPESPLTGRSIKEGSFRERFGLNVIGVRRQRESLKTSFASTALEPGDTLLLAGRWEDIQGLEGRRELVVLETPSEMTEIPAHGEKAPIAIGIMLMMLVLMTTGLLPNLTAILVAALAMILTGCVTMNEAYRSLNGSSLILIAGMLPLALAMETSGALMYLVDHLIANYGDSGPLLLCAGLFILTSFLSQFISNTATTVLVAPIALATAQGIGMNPEPFMMTVAIAASTAFATPIASPVNTLVLAPGNYRFSDFAKVGLPLQVIVLMITLLMTPMLFPFN